MVLGEIFYSWRQEEEKVKKITPICKEEIQGTISQSGSPHPWDGYGSSPHGSHFIAQEGQEGDQGSLHSFNKQKLQLINLTDLYCEIETFQYLKGAYQELEEDS